MSRLAVTYLLILLFGPGTLYQFWIQDLKPAVLTLVFSVILSKIKQMSDALHHSIGSVDITTQGVLVFTINTPLKTSSNSLVCSWQYISNHLVPVSEPEP